MSELGLKLWALAHRYGPVSEHPKNPFVKAGVPSNSALEGGVGRLRRIFVISLAES